MKLRFRYSLRLLLVLVTIVAIVSAIEFNAYRRVDTVRTLASRAPVDEIVAALGNPTDIERPMGTGFTTFPGYYAGLDWRRCLSSTWPYVRLPNRTWLLLESKDSTRKITDIWRESASSWERLYPEYDRPGAPPGW